MIISYRNILSKLENYIADEFEIDKEKNKKNYKKLQKEKSIGLIYFMVVAWFVFKIFWVYIVSPWTFIGFVYIVVVHNVANHEKKSSDWMH